MRRALHWFAMFAAVVSAAWSQQNAPHLAYAYPAGGQRGTTFEIKIGGQFLSGAISAYVSGRGVKATLGDYARPMNGMQATQLRDKVQELMKLPGDPAAQKQIVEIRRQLATFNRNVSPVLAETETLRITVEPGAETGRREMRLATPFGLSNPIATMMFAASLIATPTGSGRSTGGRPPRWPRPPPRRPGRPPSRRPWLRRPPSTLFPPPRRPLR